MPSPFRLVTLGSVHVEGSQWRPVKVLAVLSYLSLQGPTSRRRLRELFWPDAQDPGASLRVLLGQVRRQLPGVLAGEETVELRLSSDAAELLGLTTPDGGLDSIDLYGGPFLAGVELTDVSPELHEWVLDTRDRLAEAARLAAVRAAEMAGSPAEAGEWAQRAAAIAEGPAMEPELIERLLRLALPGSLLEADLRREQAEYGEQTTLAQLISSAESGLLGREQELDTLLLALSNPEVRLLEITGAGGIGKSTLAAELLREQADLSGVQVVSVPLETAQAASEAAARMVVALKLQVDDRGDGWLALAQAWGTRPLLVLLDGAEGLPDLGRGIETLLTHCAGVRVIVTSRIRRLTGLNTIGAVHLALDGLSVPAAGESAERVARSAAVQLFVRGARRYLPRFTLDATTLPLVSSIVRRLEGHPLATVLSATWIRVYPLDRIHTQILRDLTTLRAESGGGERHQLTAVFEQSWHLLDPDESRAIAALAVFQGFTPSAAEVVADVSKTMLESLKRQSLLREVGPNSQGEPRLEVPAILAAQAQMRLDDVVGARLAHSEYYLDLLLRHAPESDAVNDERDNIVAAAGFAVSQGQEVSAQIDALLASYDRRGLLTSGNDTFHALQEALLDEESQTAGSILIGLAWLAVRSSRYAEAEHLSMVILGNSQTFGDQLQMKASNIAAVSRMQRDDAAGSIPFYERAQALAESVGDLRRQVMYAMNISVAKRIIGEYASSKQLIETTVNCFWSIMSEDLKIIVESNMLSTEYYSMNEPEIKLTEKFRVYLKQYVHLKTSRDYVTSALIYVNLMLDISDLREAKQQMHVLTTVLIDMQTPDLDLANRIARIRLLYLLHRTTAARAAALAILPALQTLKEGQGLCEWLLVCGRDLIDTDLEIGTRALRLVGESLNHTHFQAERAKDLLKSEHPAYSLLSLDTHEVLEQVTALMRSD